MKEPHFHKTAEQFSVNCIRELITDKKFLDILKSTRVEINGINNYGNDTGEVVINLLIPFNKFPFIQNLITEKHKLFSKKLEDEGKKTLSITNKKEEV